MHRRTARMLLATWLLAGCGGDGRSPAAGEPARDRDGGPAPGAGDPTSTPFAISLSPSLQWKRYAAFENDLAAALDLPAAELCREFGAEPCIRGVHLSPLGGNDPFGAGLLEPSAEPLLTTPIAYDRIVLSACAQRFEAEREGALPSKVFAGLDLAGTAPAPDAPQTRALVTRLYRLFLARDPDPAEQARVGSLALTAEGRPASAAGFAQAACFVTATSTEFLFF